MADERTQDPNNAALPVHNRDGTGQDDRYNNALDPSYVAVDERSLTDLLAFAREYGKDLRFYDVLDGELQITGDWSAFISDDDDLSAVIAFMDDPAAVTPQQAERFSRPHFALFLSFLQLVRLAQDQMNDLTRRHLDFYYQQILHMTQRAAVPDHVNVLVDIAEDTPQYLLRAGTALNAGSDSAGQDLVYVTDQDALINHAQIARLRSLYVDQRLIGIREAREDYNGPHDEAIEFMFQIALGVPTSGAPLPRYDSGATVDYDFLLALQALVDYVYNGLHMTYPNFRDLIQLKQRRDNADAEWARINDLLQIAGQTRDRNFRLNPADSRDFDANLLSALGGSLPSFDGLTEVRNIYNLYDQRIREEVKAFIREQMHFTNVEDFYELMRLKIRIDAEWNEINRLLALAGQARNSAYTFPAEANPTAFDANLAHALGDLQYPTPPEEAQITNMDAYYARLQALEAYFYCSAENFSYVMQICTTQDASASEWRAVYRIMADAHERKIYAERRAGLQRIHEADGFDAMLSFALGDDAAASGLTALDRVLEYVRLDDDAQFLRDIDAALQEGVTITAENWRDVYRIVERAQRSLLPKPIAQKQEWINLYPSADATQNSISTGLAGDDTPRWQTFGQSHTHTPDDAPPEPDFGWALTSPLLALNEGQRTITVTLGFAPEDFDLEAIKDVLAPTNPGDEADDPFIVQISTEKGWIQPDTLTIKHGIYQRYIGRDAAADAQLPALQLTLTFGTDVDPIAPFPDAQIQSDWPMLRILMRQIWQPLNQNGSIGRYVTLYAPFKDLALLHCHVDVSVVGLLPLQAQNDDSTLNPAKPYEPFGIAPTYGARLLLSHPEFVTKRLDRITLNLQWMGVPADFRAHYANYAGLSVPDDASFNAVFTGRVSLMADRIEIPLDIAAALFDSEDATKPQRIAISTANALAQHKAGYDYQRAETLTTDDDLLFWNRYLQLELNAPDFQHGRYTQEAAAKSVALSAAIASGGTINAADYQINPPYTPKLKSLTIDYSSSLEITLSEHQIGGTDGIYHIRPFGYYEVLPHPDTRRHFFLPHFAHQGALYIGISGVQAPQTLSLLFQMAEGSANPDLRPMPIEWDYLSGDQWLSLEDGSLLQDTTRGLINSGIVVLSLDAAQPNTRLDPDLYWIRAAIAQSTESICDVVAIHTQAVSATFVDDDNAPDHYARPLAAGSISELVNLQPEIIGIRQPYTSYGGRMAEQDHAFYTRISERLRHKQRALTVWDYERMILDQFPQIYKVKCLPASTEQPGHVRLVIIPDITEKLPFNPFEPKAPTDLLADIKAYISDHVPPYVTLDVKNARYIQVKLRFAVRFLPGYNEGFFKKQLNDDINRFLSPWAYDDSADIVIGGRIYANVIINFIEEQHYVDYVAGIKLFSSEDGRAFQLALPAGTDDGYWVEAKAPDGVLVAARQHEIDMIYDITGAEESIIGINHMKVELDFVVSGD